MSAGSSHYTPVELETRRRRRNRRLIILGVMILLGLMSGSLYARNSDRPIAYDSELEHFKYGSIGSDRVPKGLPADVIAVLPRVFPQYLPPGAPHDYTAFGFIQEPGREWPIGFSERRQLIDLVGLNCAVCHTGTVRTSADATPTIYAAAPAHGLDLGGFFEFLFNVAADPRFTPEALMPVIEEQFDPGPIERYIMRNQAIPLLRGELIRQRALLGYLFDPTHPTMGPGRVDTFNPYKATLFMYPMDKLPKEEIYGTADYPSVYLQTAREGMNLHWDGSNSVLRQRNFSASMGAGTTPVTVDIEGLERVGAWLGPWAPPAFPFPIDQALADQGKLIYDAQCYSCHARNDFGEGSVERRETTVGQVVPLAEIGTDPYRLWSFTRELNIQLTTLRSAHPDYNLSAFKKNDGYANMPLDGLWLRGPYLHNGSVPTLADLLEPVDQRPQQFYRGYDVIDPERVGFVSNVASDGWRQFFLYRTRDDAGNLIPGNSNQGHEYGTTLTPEQKRALIEYLKTF